MISHNKRSNQIKNQILILKDVLNVICMIFYVGDFPDIFCICICKFGCDLFEYNVDALFCPNTGLGKLDRKNMTTTSKHGVKLNSAYKISSISIVILLYKYKYKLTQFRPKFLQKHSRLV